MRQPPPSWVASGHEAACLPRLTRASASVTQRLYVPYETFVMGKTFNSTFQSSNSEGGEHQTPLNIYFLHVITQNTAV